MSFLILLIGCSASEGDSGSQALTDTQSSPSDWALAPEWTPEEVAIELETALSYGMPRPEAVFDNILDLLAHGDSACPGHPTQISDLVWGLEGCTAESGYTYRGILVYEEKLDADESVELVSQLVSIADFEVIHPTGEIFLGGGTIDRLRQRSPGQESIQEGRSLIQGMWQDPLHEEAWLAEGISAYLSMLMEENDGTVVQIEGSLGIGDHHLYFDRLEFLSDHCEDAPRSGAIWIRQPDSSWFQLSYDEDCGCPELTWNETESLGELCVDTSIIREDLLESLGAVF
jgi:hypothetical protein